MKTILRTLAVAVSLFTLTGCAASPEQKAMTADICIVSGEKADPAYTADYMGTKVGFCCSKCQAKWNGLDANGKKIAFDAMKK
jgi:predicted lipoprotein with Yx(FWY)xxD motif